VYVNSCSQGALSTDVAETIDRYLASWHERGSPWDVWVDHVEALRCSFAVSIGALAEEIAVMPSASAGINAVASSLTFDSSKPIVVMGEFEFPTMAQIWLAQQRRGAVIRWVRADADELPPSSYAAAVREDTLIVPLTHVCFRNGFRTDVMSITRTCHDRGALVLLDDYQRTGSGPIDVHECGVDFMVTGCLKYLLGTSGIAFLYVRRDLVERLQPTITGWFGRINPFAFNIDTLDWAIAAKRFETGTPPVMNAYAAAAALELLSCVGQDAIRQQIARVVDRFAARARDAGYIVRTPFDPARRGPLVVLESTDAPALVARLQADGVVASCRGSGLRVSFHGYNSEQDVDAVLDALRAQPALLAEAGARSARV
jgi:selenocysteine lyase/cysteine desulfurase